MMSKVLVKKHMRYVSQSQRVQLQPEVSIQNIVIHMEEFFKNILSNPSVFWIMLVSKCPLLTQQSLSHSLVRRERYEVQSQFQFVACTKKSKLQFVSEKSKNNNNNHRLIWIRENLLKGRSFLEDRNSPKYFVELEKNPKIGRKCEEFHKV